MKSRIFKGSRKINWIPLNNRLQACAVISLSFFLCMLLVRIVEFLVISEAQFLAEPAIVFLESLINDLKFSLLLFAILFVIYFDRNWFRKLILFLLSLFAFFHLISAFYFAITLIPLDHTIYQFTLEELYFIIGTFGKFQWYYLLLVLPFILFYLIYQFFKRRSRSATNFYFIIPLLLLVSTMILPEKTGSEFSDNISLNKTSYFVKDSWEYFISPKNKQVVKLNTENEFPLLHEGNYANTMGAFFELKKESPNFVFIVVESLSSAYSGEESEISFTPFLDSLAKESIYFPNFLSTAERTFSVLPSSLASLPNGEKGFTSLNYNMPNHNSLPKILFENGYYGAFYYGGNASFDNMNVFMEFNGFEQVYDHSEFEDKGIGVNDNQFSIEDKKLFEGAVPTWPESDSPYVHVYLTSTMHYPFTFDNKESYISEVHEIISNKFPDEEARERLSSYAEVFSSSLHTDDAIRNLIDYYKSTPGSENTIFFIYGDHSFGKVPKRDKLDKYRVPLIIYSPLLKRSKTINAVNSHLDIVPSVLALLKDEYVDFNIPAEVAWLGESFDTSGSFQSNRRINFMRNSRDVKDRLENGFFITDKAIFKIADDFKLVAYNDDELFKNMAANRDSIDAVQRAIIHGNKIIPEEEELVSLVKKRTDSIGFSEKDEYVMLMQTTINNPHNKLAIRIDFQIQERSISDNASTKPMLVITIKRGDSSSFWIGQEFQELKQLSSTDSTNESSIIIDQVIRANSEFDILKNDQLKIYWWNKSDAENTYLMKDISIEIEGDL